MFSVFLFHVVWFFCSFRYFFREISIFLLNLIFFNNYLKKYIYSKIICKINSNSLSHLYQGPWVDSLHREQLLEQQMMMTAHPILWEKHPVYVKYEENYVWKICEGKYVRKICEGKYVRKICEGKYVRKIYEEKM